jgi:DNA-binding transcriptional MerR regulator
MKEQMMLKIGEFARIGQVSIVTLRHYDQYGLLKPNALDPDSGYRYYSLDQLPRLHRILALKDLGFPLDQIARLLEQDLSPAQLRELFQIKQTHIQQVIEIEQERLRRVAARLRQIEQEGIMPTYDIRLKQIDPLLVASVRATIPTSQDIGRLHEKLLAYLNQQGIQSTQADIILWHSRHEMREEGMTVDLETAVPLPTKLPGNEQVSIRILPGGLMACTVHTGNALSLGRAFVALHRWMEENEYRHAGPVRQVRLQHAEHLAPNQSITELQFPVEKR